MKSRNSLNTHSVRTNIILIGFDIYNFDTLLYLIIRNWNLKFVFYNAIMIFLIRTLDDFLCFRLTNFHTHLYGVLDLLRYLNNVVNSPTRNDIQNIFIYKNHPNTFSFQNCVFKQVCLLHF